MKGVFHFTLLPQQTINTNIKYFVEVRLEMLMCFTFFCGTKDLLLSQ